MKQDINFYAIILLLRKLRDSGLFSEKELRKVAARIAAQNRYYNELIGGKPEWNLVDIYTDAPIFLIYKYF